MTNIFNLLQALLQRPKTAPFFYKQSIFDPCPENCLSFSKNSPQKLFSSCLVDGLLTSTV